MTAAIRVADVGASTEPHTYKLSGAAEFHVGEFRVLVEHRSERQTDGAREMGLANVLRDRALAMRKAGDEIETVARELMERDGQIAELRLELANLRARHPKAPARIMATGCVRFAADGKLWILSKREKGWAAFGFVCTDWDELFRRFNVRVTAHGTDEHGPWWAVENAAEVSP